VIVRSVLWLVVSSFLLTGCFAPVVEKKLPNRQVGTTSGANYKLAPNDRVLITVFQEDDMKTDQQISRDGSVSIPLIGQVFIGGLSKGEAETLIAKKLSEKYLVSPQVSLSILEYGLQKYTILGQVGAPGAYPVPIQDEIFTLPMAVALAGGNTRIGNLRNIRIIRYSGDTISQFTVNMLSTEGQQFVILPKDLITVQETLF
jgi:protein involved in polysaccharide export with SLBB domain